jgi:hypothetical protein
MARSWLWLLALTCSFAFCPAVLAQPAMFPEPEPSSDDPLFQVESPIGSIDYVAGRGLRLGRTGLHVGGFTTLEIDKLEDEPGVLELDSLNFLISWEPVAFFRAFTDIEVDDLLSYDMRTGETFSDPAANFERLYADLSRNDALNLRIGKFQTPVGLWNLVPAEPFTWTANEPILVETAFDEHQTGGAFFGSTYPASNTLRYWAYGQFMGPLDPSEDPPPAHRSAGGRVQYADALDQWGVGSSFLASERDGSWNYLGGLDAFWQIGPLELQAEWAIVRGESRALNLWSAYVQGVYHLGHHVDLLRSLHVVGRYEHFDPVEGATASNLGNVGLTWIPARFLVLKVGYQFADQQTELVERGLFSSISILF